MAENKTVKTSLWVGSTYFIEGLPYMLVKFMSFVYFTDMGVREALLGLLNLLGIPWNLKFLWAPFLDIFGTKRGWMLKIQSALVLMTVAIAVIAGFVNKGDPSSVPLMQLIAFIFVAMGFVAATNDISIDAYYLEGLKTTEDQAAYSGLRVFTYRLAVIYARSVLVAIAGLANWFYSFGAGAVTLLVFLIIHKLFLPKFEEKRTGPTPKVKEVMKNFADSFVSYFKRDRIVLIIAFIISYKLGDEMLFSMNTPFLMRELMVTKTQLSLISGIVGSLAVVAGSMFGAWWIKTKGLKKTILPITIFMNLNILAYVLLAIMKPQGTTTSGLVFIACVHAYENIAAGLGYAALAIFLMTLCSREFKAAHFAVGTAFMSLGATIIGSFGGVLVEQFGYVWLFLLSFFAGAPSIFLLFWLPIEETRDR